MKYNELRAHVEGDHHWVFNHRPLKAYLEDAHASSHRDHPLGHTHSPQEISPPFLDSLLDRVNVLLVQIAAAGGTVWADKDADTVDEDGPSVRVDGPLYYRR